MTVTRLDQLGERITGELGKVLVGQEAVIFELVVAFFAGGHALLEGVPGLAKTLAGRALAHVLGLEYRRIQFTPDLMPSDVVGTNVLEPSTGQFRLHRGPVFTEFLLADEVNRTPPKTQAALLEAMEERHVTLDGVLHPLSSELFVVATQNPVELEGTYPLPEAQVDRFLVKILLDYPSLDEELRLLATRTSSRPPTDLAALGLERVIERGALAQMRDQVASVRCEPDVVDYVARIVRTTRASERIALGASPRGGIGLLWCARTAAALAGRDFVIPDDIKRFAPSVLRHRLLLRPEALVEGLTPDDVIAELLERLPVPR